MTADARIRAAGADDVAAVLALWQAAGSIPTVTDGEEHVRRLLDVDAEALLVAETGTGLAGSIIAGWNGWRGSLYRLAVAPRHRRQGLGTALVREAEARLRARGAVRIDAVVAAGERPALGFWRAAGYEPQPDQVRFVRTFAADG